VLEEGKFQEFYVFRYAKGRAWLCQKGAPRGPRTPDKERLCSLRVRCRQFLEKEKEKAALRTLEFKAKPSARGENLQGSDIWLVQITWA